MVSYILLVSLIIGTSAAATTYEEKVQFFGYNNQSLSTSPFVSDFDSAIATRCNPNSTFTIIVPTGREDLNTPWVEPMIKNFLYYRGGCVLFMDYSSFVTETRFRHYHFKGIHEVLKKKMQQIGNYNRQLCFGFGVGARICVAAGLALGNSVIDRMELVDPVGPLYDNSVDPKPAAKNAACINCSTDKGTETYNCHQNFRMGKCGDSQAGAGNAPLGSHGLCPYFYLLAFTNNFIPNNLYKCTSIRTSNVLDNVKMGYNAVFNRTFVRGDIFIATAKYVPYVVENNVIDNKLTSMIDYINKGPASGIRLNTTRT